jgi:fumarate reductase subunit D
MSGKAWRNRNHPAWWAFIVHRVSGLLLAAFIPLHFWALGQALSGEAALGGSSSGRRTRW